MNSSSHNIKRLKKVKTSHEYKFRGSLSSGGIVAFVCNVKDETQYIRYEEYICVPTTITGERYEKEIDKITRFAEAYVRLLGIKAELRTANRHKTLERFMPGLFGFIPG